MADGSSLKRNSKTRVVFSVFLSQGCVNEPKQDLTPAEETARFPRHLHEPCCEMNQARTC